MTDDTYMRRAVRLASRAAGRTSPNANVGAVVVRDGVVVGEGFYRAVGGPHAEVEAFRKAGAKAKGATLYVTLEPCAHEGRTPPCVDAVIASGVVRVVAAVRDPDPRTNGKGFRAIRAAGIAVEEGLLADEATAVNAGFLSRVRRGRPHVTVKLATTVDGRVSVPGRRSVIGKPALREVHRLRDRSDAVLVGIDTVLADDPQLTVREVRGRDPLRVIVDADAQTPATARVVRGKDPQRTVIFVARDAALARTKRLRDAGVLLVTAPRVESGLDLTAVMAWLAQQGVNTVLSEGSPRIASALITAKLADRLLFYVAPFAGGTGAEALPGLAETLTLRRSTTRKVGDDLAITGELD